MNFIPTELTVKPSKELSRAIAAELAKEDDEKTRALLNEIVEGVNNDDENKTAKTKE